MLGARLSLRMGSESNRAVGASERSSDDRREISMTASESPLGDSAVQLHEMFLELQRAGFTEDQALRYLAYCTIGKNYGPEDKPEDR